MTEKLSTFERVVRRAHLFTDATPAQPGHPFEERNIFERLPNVVRDLFDDGHYAQATFEAFKFLDNEIARLSSSSDFGKSLMMKAFNESAPLIKLNSLTNESERNEQEGFKFIFAGAVIAIRNPRGHDYEVRDTMDDCLDHLAFVSMMARRVERAGFKFQP
jgi:uncharacterized protein (TIGR02391 family)